MNEVVEETIPLARRTNKRRPLVNNMVEEERRTKSKVWKRMQQMRLINHGNEGEHVARQLEQAKEKYIKKRNAAKEINRRKIREYEEKLSQNIKRDNKSFYRYMRSKQKRRERVEPLKNDLGEIITEEEEMASMLNIYFGSVLTDEDVENIPEPIKLFEGGYDQMLTELHITEEMVVESLGNLREDKTPGIDEIHPKFLKEVRHEVGAILSTMYNESIRTGIVPKDWRDAIVKPLFKKGNRSETGIYRPISLTCMVCKVLESMVKRVIVEHLEDNKLIKISQHGFMKGRSCLTNLLDFFEEVYDELDTNNQVDLVCLDFAKAFDEVHHKRLIRKMQACGVQGSILQWITKWLTNRRQRVRIRGKDSNWINITSGVPKGSVLGPLLFVISMA